MKQENFNDRFQTFNLNSSKLRKSADHAVRAVRKAKAAAYRMATSYVAMQSQDHNQLIEMIRSTHGPGPEAINKWVDDYFSPLAQIGEDVWALIKAVQEGMTLKLYLATTPALFLNEKKREKQAASIPSVPVVAPPPNDMSPEQQAEFWKAKATELNIVVKEMRKQQRLTQQRVALLESTIKKLQRNLQPALSSAA